VETHVMQPHHCKSVSARHRWERCGLGEPKKFAMSKSSGDLAEELKCALPNQARKLVPPLPTRDDLHVSNNKCMNRRTSTPSTAIHAHGLCWVINVKR